MLRKVWNPEAGGYEVTFDLPGDLDIEGAHVVGEFNDWSETATPMARGDDGHWSATVVLPADAEMRFRYRLASGGWENDWTADDYVDNDFGGSDSVVRTAAAPAGDGTEPPPVKAATKKKAAKKKAGTKKKAAKKKAASKKKAAKKKAATKKAATKKAAPKDQPPA